MIVTIMEIWSFLQLPVAWLVFRKFAKRNVLGELIAGAIIGVFIEFSTEALWDYHFRITVYKDIPLCVILGWGLMFTLATYFSERLYRWVFRKDSVDDTDKRIFLTDAFSALAIALPLEKLGLVLGLWEYNPEIGQWEWGQIPFFDMPWEVLFGYTVLMLVGPTFVRHWERELET